MTVRVRSSHCIVSPSRQKLPPTDEAIVSATAYCAFAEQNRWAAVICPQETHAELADI